MDGVLKKCYNDITNITENEKILVQNLTWTYTGAVTVFLSNYAITQT